MAMFAVDVAAVLPLAAELAALGAAERAALGRAVRILERLPGNPRTR